jgi:UDP-2,4-diacetamido-2,4,6-trideoxy-beta-L-altropyranose hydrolase
LDSKTFLFRVDASAKVGTGHLQRCLLLADYFVSKENCKVVFLSTNGFAKKIIEQSGYDCFLVSSKYNSVSRYLKNLEELPIVVADINSENIFENHSLYLSYIQKLKNDSKIIITFEDLVDYPFSADIVLIPYAGAEKLKLNRDKKVTYLLGPSYFPVRNEFKINKRPFISKKAKKILITMGGSDPSKITLLVLNSLKNNEHKLDFTILIGPASKIKNEEVEKILENYTGNYHIIRNINNISSLIYNSDIIISNSGLTKYEIALVGIPSILISNNKKQAEFNDLFCKYGSSIHLGEYTRLNDEIISSACFKLLADFKKRSKMSINGRNIIDSNGADRIYKKINHLISD